MDEEQAATVRRHSNGNYNVPDILHVVVSAVHAKYSNQERRTCILCIVWLMELFWKPQGRAGSVS